jgi:secreted PhoX family phosphatase
MLYSRRALIRSAATLALAAPALKFLSGCATAGPAGVGPKASALELIPDPKGLLDLAPGLRYWVVSQTGDVMSDGLAEPGKHDGMATFPVAGEPDRCLIVRNHELGADDGDAGIGAFGRDGAGASKIEPSLIYDRTPGGRPHSGGTTTTDAGRSRPAPLVSSFRSSRRPMPAWT